MPETSRPFSKIHKIVVGILSLSLEVQLQDQMYRAEMDAHDSRGRSPLHWAAPRGDSSVKTLLRAGANTKRQDHERGTALLAAVQSSSVRCTELLLMADGDVHYGRIWP